MRFIHISDLHIGKRVNEKSLLEEQSHILKQICSIIEATRPDAVLIAGDVYDKAVPSAEAVMLFDSFLVDLSSLAEHIFIISGNHDSAERIAFGSKIMSGSGIHLSPVYDGKIRPVTLSDEYGYIDIYMLPYLRPVTVRHHLPEEEKEEVDSYDSAVRKAIEKMGINTDRRNIIVTHQFVTGSQRSESEDVNVGGLDNVDANAFEDFDYVALGHLHRPQDCQDERIRYCGSPLKYSFSEVNDHKSVTLVELKEKGSLRREIIPLKPLHDWHDLKGTYEELTSRSYYADTTYREDFVRITLTDENDIPDAVGKLRAIYRNLMELRYDNTRTRAGHTAVGTVSKAETMTPEELFGELFIKQNAAEMDERQLRFLNSIISRIEEEGR